MGGVEATAAERRRALSGDGFVCNATGAVMHGGTIAAPPDSVWRWLVQMGAGRAGWYSYDWIDNDGRPSATKIVPELQHLAVGDIMPSLPGATDAFVVAAIEPSRDLVLTVPAADGSTLVSWEFFLEPIEGRRTRLLVRGRVGAQWPGGGAGKTFVRTTSHRTGLLAAGAHAALGDDPPQWSATLSCRRVNFGASSAAPKARRRSWRIGNFAEKHRSPDRPVPRFSVVGLSTLRTSRSSCASSRVFRAQSCWPTAKRCTSAREQFIRTQAR